LQESNNSSNITF